LTRSHKFKGGDGYEIVIFQMAGIVFSVQMVILLILRVIWLLAPLYLLEFSGFIELSLLSELLG
jgi:hypothetical protein